MKRVLDIAVATVGLTISAPLLAALAVAVKLESPGPALFVQTRIGRGRRPFRLVKLRTMKSSAGGPSVTASGDARVTRVGALLRRTKLDELPQLWNVLRGDMSIVGPRPEVPGFVEKYRPEWQRLLDVRPGITDLASLTFRDEETLLSGAHDRERAYTEVVMPMKLELALKGVARESLLDDLAVILRTAASIVRPQSDHPVLIEAARRIAELEHKREVT